MLRGKKSVVCVAQCVAVLHWLTYEMESEGKLSFLDLLIVRNEVGDVKLQIYRKLTHTDQYLNFCSHHPIEHKLSVVRTLRKKPVFSLRQS